MFLGANYFMVPVGIRGSAGAGPSQIFSGPSFERHVVCRDVFGF